MRFALVAAAVLSLAACKKDSAAEAKPSATKTAPATAGKTENGVRTIAVEAGKDGYSPETIVGKPGEKLKLVFTRTVDSECISELVAPDGKKVALPLNKPVDVDVTVPQSGELAFACGMDMFHGKIVAQGS
ncbi:MAG TPA: cupredoxin domain-containing protein [Kofleriaceae bacterium]|jgi:plastocyanin domain-containing protein